MKTAEIIKEIEEMTDVDKLREVANIAWQRMKDIRDEKADLIHWLVGKMVKMKPRYQSKKPWDTEGKIIKINSKTLKVVFDGTTFNIPKSMLDLVK